MSPAALRRLKSIADELFAADVAGRSIAAPPALAGLSAADAYAVQAGLVERREAAGSACCGWKLGITSRVKQTVMGIDRPLFGRIFCNGERENGAHVRHASFIAPRTEPEIAIVLGRAVQAGMTSAELRASVAAVATALEITDSRLGAGKRTAVELIADNTSSSAYVLGPQIDVRSAPAYGDLPAELVRNGEIVAAGSTADVLGDPLNALAALAEHLAAHGLQSRAGDIVLSGAITDAIAVAPGDVVQARIAALGTAQITFA